MFCEREMNLELMIVEDNLMLEITLVNPYPRFPLVVAYESILKSKITKDLLLGNSSIACYCHPSSTATIVKEAQALSTIVVIYNANASGIQNARRH